MNRRHFLAAAALAPFVGCRRRTSPAEQRVTAADRERIAAESIQREAQREFQRKYQLPADAVRTTNAPPRDLSKEFPELKPRTRAAVRLHPRSGEEPGPSESKLGGQFVWPATEAWPICERFKIPLTPVLQLRLAEAPPGFPFFKDNDLLQLLWSARDHDGGGPLPKIVWRKAYTVTGELLAAPTSEWAFPLFAPLEARFHPEVVIELPHLATFPEGHLKRKLEAGNRQQYRDELSTAPGTKIGGYPRWNTEPRPPSCETCHWAMDYLLTVSNRDWEPGSRWIPKEESAEAANSGMATATGLNLPEPGWMNIFVCRRCPDWPVQRAA